MPKARTSPKEPADAAPIQTVAFVSLGCPKNLVDSEKMLGLLAEDGLLPVSDDAGDQADAIVINTCGFLEASKQESLDVIGEALRRKEGGEVKRVVVAGCLVQRHRAKLLEWAPGIDALVGVFDRDHIVEAVRGTPAVRTSLADASDAPRYWVAGNALQAAKERGMPTVGLTVNGKDGKGLGYFESDSARLRLTPRHYAYLRVSEGCNQACAFCTIPSIRGKMRSKPVDAILREARELLRDGAFELNLIGQDTTSYGDDIGCGFRAGKDFRAMQGLPGLLQALDDTVAEEAGRGGAWLRLMYAYPTNFADEMIDAVASLPSVTPYIDIPLQHASDRMLKAMRRHVSAAHQRDLIHRLRERGRADRPFAVRTTFITGFPGETEEDHEILMDFVREMRFEMMGVFEYSREDGTPAGTMEQDPALAVPPEVKARRCEELMLLQQEIAFEKASSLAARFDESDPNSGARFDVLIDGEVEGPAPARRGAKHRTTFRTYAGRTYFQAPQIDSATIVRSREALSPGELVRCVIVESDGYDLVAAPVADLEARLSLPVVR